MKRIICVLAVALFCLSACCLAEIDPAVADLFTDTWVDDGVAVEIWPEDDGFHCHAVLGDGSGDANVIRYETCRYNAGEKALECEGGVRTFESSDYDAGELKTDVVATGLTATFTVDERDRLIWNDSEGIAKRFALLRLSDAEEQEYREMASAFLGSWACDRASIEITEDGDDYRAVITWANDYQSQVEWDYACVYDDMENVMRCVGAKANVTCGEDGSETGRELLYESGEATLSIEDGKLIWNDAQEDAGAGMAFERN